MRQAILAANADDGPSLIRFDRGFFSVSRTISPVATHFPPLTGDGDTIQGSIDNLGRPLVVIDGQNNYSYGLRITGKNITVARLIFIRFTGLQDPAGAGVWITTPDATGNRIEGCYFGVRPDQTTAEPNRYGVRITNDASQNYVGEVNTSARRNILAGNLSSGVSITDGANGNFVYGNYIGATLNGPDVVALGNGDAGIELSNASGNVIGTSLPDERFNLISANGQAGIRISGNSIGNVVRANNIGTNVVGDAALGTQPVGVLIEQEASNNELVGVPLTAPLVISGNTQYGVLITTNAANNRVRSAFIGTNYLGDTALPNGAGGVRIENGATNNIIGPDTVVSGNAGDGIVLTRGSAPTATWPLRNRIERSIIGLNADATAPLPNTGRGVAVLDGARGTVVGIDSTSEAFLGNIIAGNVQEGVLVEGQTNQDTLVRGNVIGLRRTTRSGPIIIAEPNGGDAGILVTSGARWTRVERNTIGGAASESSGIPGIWVRGDGSGSVGVPSPTNIEKVFLVGNRVGCLPSNNASPPCSPEPTPRPNREGIVVSGGVRNVELITNTVQLNFGAGIRLSDVYTVTLRSDTSDARSIAFNTGNGIQVDGSSFNVSLLDTTVLQNGEHGILVAGTTSNIVVFNNTLRANLGRAIRLDGNVQRVRMQNNRLTRNQGGAIELVGTTVNFPPGSNPGDLNRPNHDIDPPIVDPSFASPQRLRLFQSGRVEGYVLPSADPADQPPNPPSACVNCSIQFFEPDPELASPDEQGFNLLRAAADIGASGQDSLTAAANGFFSGFLQLSDGRLPRQLLLIATDGRGNSSEYARFDVTTGLVLEPTSPLAASRSPGETVTYTLRVRNTGSVDFDNLVLETSGTLSGWQLTATPAPGAVFLPPLPAGGTRDITVTLTLPLGDHPNVRVPRSDVTTVIVRSAGVATATATLETTVLGRPIIRVTPPRSIGAGRPNEQVPHSYVLRNDGNVTVTLGLSFFTRDPAISPDIWPTTLNTSTLTLPPGSQRDLLAEVTVPAGAQQSVGGQLVEATTFITGTIPASTEFGYPSSTVPFSATTRVNVVPRAIIYSDQEQRAAAGSEVRFVHTVENKSNGPARFCLATVTNQQSSVRFESATNGFVIDGQGCFSMDTTTDFVAGRFQLAQFVVIVRTNERLPVDEIETVNVFLRKDTPDGETLAEARLVDRIVITRGEDEQSTEERRVFVWLPLVRR
ncbi:MAG: right-handed parallel beta-helix repeat-containing protein [Chloroflexaceae bacterium]